MQTDHNLETRLAQTWPPEAWCDVTVLVAVSGGPDSVAALRAIASLKRGGEGGLRVAHFNHQLRSPQAEQDEAFVVELCEQLDLPCELGRARVDQLAIQAGDGLEAAARAARYDFLESAAAKVGARYVVTGHTADDQAETILHRIVRGTGVGGLAGMARARPLGEATTLIRPLLTFRRSELIAYLDELGQDYRQDISNDDVRFTRNRIRHRLLPELAEQFNPGVADALLRLGSLAGEMQTVIDQLVDDLSRRCLTDGPADTIQLDTGPLADQPRYVVRELLIAAWRDRGWPMQSMGFEQWDLLADMVLDADPHKHTFPGNIMAERSLDALVILRQ